MKPSGSPLFRLLHATCLVVAIMMVLSVSVHPALAQEAVKDQVAGANATLDQLRALKDAGPSGCVNCAAADSLARGELPGYNGISLRIRQIPLDASEGNATIAGAETHTVGNITISVRSNDWDDEKEQLPAGAERSAETVYGEGSSTATRSFSNSTVAERLADFDNDPVIKAYLRNVTEAMGFSIRSEVHIERYAFDYNQSNATKTISNISAKPVITDLARYTYANATGYRYKFYAIQQYAADGTPIPPKEIIPGAIYPPKAEIKDDTDCWWAYALLVLAIVALILAIIAAIGIRIFDWFTSGAGGGADAAKGRLDASRAQANQEFRPARFQPSRQDIAISDSLMERRDWLQGRSGGDGAAWWDPQRLTDRMILRDMDNIHDPNYWSHLDPSVPGDPGQPLPTRFQGPEVPIYVNYIHEQNAQRDVFLAHQAALKVTITLQWVIFIILIIAQFVSVFMDAFGSLLITASILAVTAAVLLLLLCKNVVKDENDRATLRERLNPEHWTFISERNNGALVYVPDWRPSEVYIMLDEKNETGSGYHEWNVTSMNHGSFVMYDSAHDLWRRTWIYTVRPGETPCTFSARYVRSDDPAGPAEKTFTVTFAPVSWSLPEAVDDNPHRTAVRYGSSIATDPATDRMHITYLTSNDPNGGTRPQLMYRSGIGTQWDPPVVVDAAPGGLHDINVDGPDELEMARTTSIALDPEGNPHISYRDNANGHLKYAHLLTDMNVSTLDATPFGFVPPEGLVHNGWLIETVDDSSGYTGWGSSIAIDRDGNPHIAYLHQDTYEGELFLRYASRNSRGGGWITETVPLGSNTLGDHAVFPKDYSCFRLGFSSIPIWGYTSSNIDRGESPSLAMDSHGNPHISLARYVIGMEGLSLVQTNTTLAQLHLRSYRNNYALLHIWKSPEPGNGHDKEWRIELADDHPINIPDWAHFTRHGLYSSIAIDSHDRPHISYFTAIDEICQWMEDTGLYQDAPSAQGYFNRPPENVLMLNCHTLLGYLRYAWSDDEGWHTETVEDQSVSAGEYSSLALDKDDNPHIAYMDMHNKYLMYATRSAPGAAWFFAQPNRETEYYVPGFASTAGFSSISLDAHGSPRIVYVGGAGNISVTYGKIPPKTTWVNQSRDTAVMAVTETATPAPDDTGNNDVPGDDRGKTAPEDPVAVSPLIPAGSPDQVRESDSAPGMFISAPAAAAGQEVTYPLDAAASGADPLVVHAITFTPAQAIRGSVAYAHPSGPSPDVKLRDRPALYEEIGIRGVSTGAISNAAVEFSVSGTWLTANGIDPANVRLMRLHDGVWTKLPTTFSRQDGDRYYFMATTPGFSYFAVTDGSATAAVPEKATSAVAAGTPAPAGEPPSPASPSPARGPIKAVSGAVVTQTTVPAPAPGDAGPAAGFPLFWIAIAALVSLLGIAGFFIGRRMWWAHQNPALFRKYD